MMMDFYESFGKAANEDKTIDAKAEQIDKPGPAIPWCNARMQDTDAEHQQASI